MSAPAIFGEGVISTGDYESHPAFTPDGRTLYFVKSTPSFSFWTIVVSRFADGQWSTPEVAPFSGRYSDADPFITADGKQLYFISRRPGPGKTKPDLDIWVTDKTGDGWSEPRNLGAPVNSGGNEWYPTLAADGTLYFGSDRPGGKGATDLYRSRLVNGKYQEPENLGEAINTEFDEFEPWIAPDQSYVIFMAAGRPDSHSGSSDLYISHQKDGVWTKAQNLGNQINSPREEYSPKVSPDGKYFFFSSARGRRPPEKQMNYAELLAWLRGPRNGLGDIYQVDLRSVSTFAAPSGGLGDRVGAPEPPIQVSSSVDRTALYALAERIDKAVHSAEPTLRLVTRHGTADNPPLLMGWQSENEWVSVTVYSVGSSEDAGELLHKILAAPVAELPKEVLRMEVGDEGFLLLPQRGGGAQAVFRSRSFVVQMSATSPELTKRFASHIATQISQIE